MKAILLVAAFLCGAAGAAVGQVWLFRHELHVVIIASTSVARLSDGSHKMMVDTLAQPNNNCLRITHHVLTRDNPRTYVPLAMALSGRAFGSVERFRVTLFVPAGVPLGEWRYTARSAYQCVGWPGLLGITELQSEPVTITLD
jgi:hypothetical protein